MSVDIPRVADFDDESLERMIQDCEMQRDICESFVVRGQQEQARRRKMARQQKREGLPAVLPETRRKMN